MTLRVRSSLLLLFVALAAGAIGAGVFLREPIERAWFAHAVRGATSMIVDADEVERDGGAYEVRGLRAYSPGGALVLDAPRARVALGAERLDLTLVRPRFIFDPDRAATLPAALRDTALALRVSDGTLTIVSGEVPDPILTFDALDVMLGIAAGEARYDVSLALRDGNARYPIAGHSVAQADGEIVQTWSAPLLPLAPFASLLGSGDVHVRDGRLDDVEVEAGHSLRATFHLDDLSLGLGSHALTGVHGDVTLADRGLGSSRLAGFIDGVAIDAAGEVHDVPSRYGWLRDGSKDLSRVARLVELIAAEPHLRSAHVEMTAPGLAFGQYGLATDHGPLAISLLSIDPNEPSLRFGTALAEDRIISGGERTSAMGVRTNAVAGVNGDYFDIGRTYQPQGMLVRDGELLRGPVDRAALAIDAQKHVTFAEFHFVGSVAVDGRSFPVTQFNDWPAGEVTVVTPAFGKVLPAAPGTTFAELTPLGGKDAHRYRVAAVEKVDAPIPARFGLAFGPKTTSTLHPGQVLTLTYGTDPPLDGAVAAIGGGPILIKDGAWYEDPHAPAPDERDYRWPVVALARRADGDLFLVAVDGRHPERSVGMKRPEFGDLLLRLGAVDAMALDSGGSVTMVSRAPGNATVTVRNVPSDFSAERWISDGLFLYSSAPPPSIVPAAVSATPLPEARPTP